MARFSLDTSGLLGFDRDGNPLWGIAGTGSGSTGAHGVAKAAGMAKDDDYPFWDFEFPSGDSDPVTNSTSVEFDAPLLKDPTSDDDE